MSKFGWAYLGVGDIAHGTAKQLRKSENSEIVAVWNRTYEKAEKFAKKFGGTPYHTFEEAVNDPRVEGVYIALTANLHYEYMKKCIELHKPVLCESRSRSTQRRRRRSSNWRKRKASMSRKRCGPGTTHRLRP